MSQQPNNQYGQGAAPPPTYRQATSSNLNQLANKPQEPLPPPLPLSAQVPRLQQQSGQGYAPPQQYQQQPIQQQPIQQLHRQPEVKHDDQKVKMERLRALAGR